ncbi:Sugar-specific transcriptional regulator TrmB [Halogranum gelatinilyticum]|uniref:Sugar-specific transcriptional regulator TrmB n=1 Tax=Halogranum gelatinilyticum TaxID=660521 RepID=A0A1G9ZMV3_9EURY|nr:Sugar-specific transcriptional regulator TrmB [Halogranum gelatinilyticum]
METSGLVDTLEEAGLAPYQAKAYVGLLELETGSAQEIANASGIPNARVYDVLRDLEEMGYVELYEQDTLRARALDPDIITEDLNRRIKRFEKATDEIQTRWQRPSIDDHTISIIRRFKTILETAKQFISEADTQIHATLTRKQYDKLEWDLAKAYQRGVTVNVTILQSNHGESLKQEHIEGVCTAVRERPHSSPFILIADLEKTAFAPDPISIEEYGVTLENRSFTHVFFWYFLSFMWLPWSELYSEVGEKTPIRYADIREFIIDYEPFLMDGATLKVVVEGLDIQTQEARQLSGTVVDIAYADELSFMSDSNPLKLMGIASISIQTDEGVYTVGGWGAQYEDIEARRITVVESEKES